MFREVCLKNFRAVENRCVKLGDFTLIYGPPNSGKSTFLEALAFLIQSRGEEWLALEGPLLIIHEPEDIHQGGDLEKPFVVEFTAAVESGLVTYGYKYATATNYVEQWVASGGVLLAHMAKRGDGGYLVEPVEAKLCVTPYAVISEDVLTLCSQVEDERVKAAERALLELRIGLKDRFYLISSRRLAAWKYTYETHVDLMPATSVGSEGQFVPHHLSKVLTQPSFHRAREELYRYLPLAGVEDVKVGFIKSGRLAMYIRDRHWTNVYNAGLYTKSVMPIVVQLVLANAGSSIFIDDVDLAVPSDRAEVLLSGLLEATRRRGLQLVATIKEPGFKKVGEKLGFEVVEL